MTIDYSSIQAIGPEIWKWLVRAMYLAIFAGLAYAAAYFFNRFKRYNYIVRIFNRDATGHIVQQPDDKGGIFLDKKTSYRLFLLRKNKFGLDPDEIPYILTSKGRKLVYLIQTGLKNFQFLKPDISSNPGLVFNVQDEDVAWALNAYVRHKAIFQNNIWQQIMPFLGMTFVFVTVMISLYWVFQNLGTLQGVADAMKEAAMAMKDVAKLQNLGAVVE